MWNLLPEFIASVSVVLTGVLLALLPSDRFQRAREAGLQLGMLGASLAILLRGEETGVIPLFELLESNSLLRLPRAAIFLMACLIARMVTGTRQIPKGRKPEMMFLLGSTALLSDLLLLSNHLALSYVLLAILTWMGAFLAGMGYRGAREGEALLKHWVQGSVAVVLSLGGLVAVSTMAGGLQYEQIASYIAGLQPFSPGRLFMIFVLYLPFLMVAGLFPFHLVPVDRDDGAPWATQSIFSIIGSGAVVLALWSMAVQIFRGADPSQVPDGLRCLQFCGLFGGFWLAFFSLSQKNSKRLFSGLVGGSWSLLLVSGSLHSPMAASSMVYGSSSLLLWASLLGFVWSRLQEGVGQESVAAIYGAARVNRGYGFLLLAALACPLLLPAFPGFASILLQFASVIEQKNLLLLLFFALLLILYVAIAGSLAADMLFRGAATTSLRPANSLVQCDAWDLIPLTVLLAGSLSLGLFANRVFDSLYESAKPFLN